MTPVQAKQSRASSERPETPHERLLRLIATERCVILDGAVGTELIEVGGQRPEADEHLWGVTAILDAPAEVKAVHSHVDVGCDVIDQHLGPPDGAARWQPAARRGLGTGPLDGWPAGVQLACGAATEAGRGDEVAVAFSINGDVDTLDGRETIRLLARAFEAERPDLILLETLSLVRSSHSRHRRGPARHQSPGVAELPALPSRGVRRLRRALGRTRG